MPTVTFEGRSYPTEPGETVLTALLRQGGAIPHSCRSGVCRSCLVRATQGTPPASSQKALKDTLRAQGYFLSCIAQPESELTVALPSDGVIGHTRAQLLAREQLAPDIFRLRLQAEEAFPFMAGQFITIRRPDGLRRSYSLAAPPTSDGTIELHVRRLPQGQLSGWLCEALELGAWVDLFGPEGSCFYLPDDPTRPLLLIGTGTGLAPLLGIVRDALAQGHTGPIQLFHGSRHPDGLYLQGELAALTVTHPNLTYTLCTSATGPRADVAAFGAIPDTSGWRVYLCGNPEMVKGAQRKAFLLGASLAEIYTDPFVRAG
ncbi:2Fe-2S iron-sulfur cluster-binding protein [Armatimonas rosea]|uniref:Ferredoxin-NADP reductase/ferredoxin n=1 Tax=Armatimonas rosea TaxID=685828 RepID=A0A7W9SM62_ARMRO|nr:2Fe-2S iron-sulfur cluster-binding protein [Armatimonas rosea]MBB6049197.1 ferredoxin-NADP reductase/ferredoxin [Armatimonas rosea]